ncbi:MAG: 50S ribosome-binding GTPase, partial [Candidatus Heimdallarchaeota archaeon]|nr:50S ribosome-binding GTPase [Candidatus Heimdallarchaeota archaeon]
MDISISRSLKIKPPSGKMSSLKRSQVHEINRINTIVNIVADRIRRTVTSFPSIDQLHPFYTELSGVLTDLDNVKENLGRLNGSILTLRSIEEQLVTKILESGSKPETKSLRRIAFARLSSVVHRINAPLVNLEASRAILQSLPSFNPYLPSVVVCGFPNSGKSSFVKLVSSGKPEVASYPFTTKKIIFGHKKIDFLTVQFVDTPGILDRPLEDRNEIELQALVALKHLSDVMLFLIDVASSASWG